METMTNDDCIPAGDRFVLIFSGNEAELELGSIGTLLASSPLNGEFHFNVCRA